MQQLADYSIRRHHPDAAEAENPYLAFYERVVDTQASLVAQWMLVGFIHGVMNTDNMAISGETIDYGPCAFMDAFDPATVFSSIDHGGRYAYGNQPQVAAWNLARLAEALLPLIDEDDDAAVASGDQLLTNLPRALPPVLERRDAREARVGRGRRRDRRAHRRSADAAARARRRLHVELPGASASLRGEVAARSLFAESSAFNAWEGRWREQLAHERSDATQTAAAMDRVNPVYIPRNHQVEAALAAATAGDLEPFERLLDAVTHPFDERPGLEAYAAPAPLSWGAYQTFCGT